MSTVLVFLVAMYLQIVTQSSAPPHILFVVIDDLGFTDTGYHGAEFITSNLDALASNGVDLTNYYVQMDCTPTRSSLMTGLNPWRIGFQNPTTMPSGVKAHLPFHTATIAEQMKRAGYNTQMIGKWHLGYAALNMTPTGRGFNDFYGYYNGAEDYYFHSIDGGYDLVYNNQPQQQVNGTYNADLFFNHYMQYLGEHYNQSASTQQQPQQPLYTYFALQTIHAPIEQPPMINANGVNMSSIYQQQCAHIGDTQRMYYCQKLQYVDVYIGELIDTYKQLNLWNNTLLIVSTDNGAMPRWNATRPMNFTDALSVGQNYPYRAGKVTLFQGGVLGSCFVSGPLIPEKLRGTTNKNLFAAVDWFPSILSFVGHKELIPEKLDGRNIMDNIMGTDDGAFNRSELVLFSNFDVIQGVVVQSLLQGAVIDGDWKYIHGNQPYDCYYPHPPQQPICLTNETVTGKYLFNLKHDPFEADNVIDTYPERAVKMMQLIVEDARLNGYEYNYLDVQWNSSCPRWHDGNWLSWLEQAPKDDVVVQNCDEAV